MLKYIACTALELDFGVHQVASYVVSGSTNGVTSNGKALYYGTLQVTLMGITNAAGFNCPTAVVYISPSSKDVTMGGIEGSPALLEGDSGSTVGVFVGSGTPPPTSTETINVKIKSAGQKEVKAA